MAAALWSASLNDVLQFPADQLIGFLCNHKMLQLFHRPQWKTVKGRSRSYVEAAWQHYNNGRRLLDDGQQQQRVHLRTAVEGLERLEDGKYRLLVVEANGHGGDGGADFVVVAIAFDQVVFACHPPVAAKILLRGDDNNGSNRKSVAELLGQIEYADNVVYVHSDPSLMPRSDNCWASWNCLGNSRKMKQRGTSSQKSEEAFEGGESGFGNTVKQQQQQQGASDNTQSLEGPEGRFKAVYVT